MFRRRWFGPIVRRPIIRGAMVGGLGYLLGRRAAGRDPTGSPDAAQGASATSLPSAGARLAELDRMRDAGQVTGAEYEAKREEILRGL